MIHCLTVCQSWLKISKRRSEDRKYFLPDPDNSCSSYCSSSCSSHTIIGSPFRMRSNWRPPSSTATLTYQVWKVWTFMSSSSFTDQTSQISESVDFWLQSTDTVVIRTVSNDYRLTLIIDTRWYADIFGSDNVKRAAVNALSHLGSPSPR